MGGERRNLRIAFGKKILLDKQLLEPRRVGRFGRPHLGRRPGIGWADLAL
ncbi:MAG: hypothetical protein QXY42_05120 [Candidatus Bathyarchaeia archaeon]